MNKCVLLGRIATDVELRKTQTGIESCVFTIAINNGKDKNGNEREADFIPCRAWRETACFIAKWFSKGKMILVEGKFKTDKYQHKKYPDVTVYNSYVLVNNVEFCGDKGNSQQTTQPTAQNVVQAAQNSGIDTKMDTGSLGEFEEILSDGEIPF